MTQRARPALTAPPQPAGAAPAGAGRCEACDARTSTVCACIALEHLQRLAAISVSLDIAPGRGFIEEGAPAEHFFNVTAGTAKLFKQLPDGRRLITGFAGLGDFLGLAVTDSYSYSAEAVDAVRICRYSRPKLKLLLVDFPAMELRLLEATSNELVAAQEQMLLLGRKTARERMASFLVGRADGAELRAGPRAPPCGSVVLPMSRHDVADYLGLTVETVSRVLGRLTREGLIAIPTPWEITIRNAVALRHLAAGSA